MASPKNIVYSIIIGDLFHYGHLKMLETAKKSGDYHICGVISDDVVKKWITPLICNYEERKEVIDKIKYVDETICQDSLDPTENLKKLHSRFPSAKILLIQNHILGGNSILGLDYIKEINGEVVFHNFYSNLSREHIRNIFLKEAAGKNNIKNISVSDIKIADIDFFKKHFSTKANTIQSLKRVLKNAIIEKEFVFTVGQWGKDKEQIVKEISGLFLNQKIVIRSSSMNEDSIDQSNAGHYDSFLNVDANDYGEVTLAVNKVVNSYQSAKNIFSENQVLVQKQTEDVAISGVVFTRNLWTNTPYYLINYDETTSKTDTVTSGIESSKIEILNDLPLDEIIPKWYGLVSAIREIEQFFKGLTLDIEFAIKSNGNVVIFQVRPLAANSKFYSFDDDSIKQKIRLLQEEYRNLENNNNTEILSEEIFLSDMAFWNPAELIGDRPNYLDYSLFNHLLMKSNWNQALLPLGYSKVNDGLMVLVGNKPYINVHHAFLTLLPDDIPSALKKKLLNFYNKKLKGKPELHDKIEFNIVHSCYSFDFDKQSEELMKNNFTSDEIACLKQSLIDFTNNILQTWGSVVEKDNKDIAELEIKYTAFKKRLSNNCEWNEKLEILFLLIEDCRKYGTLQFSRVARLAFISNSLLKSLVNTGTVSSSELDDFMNSINTVASEMDRDFNRLKNKKFSLETYMEKYGHLRPGTFDINNFPYSKNAFILNLDKGILEIENTNITESETIKIQSLIHKAIVDQCKKHSIKIDVSHTLDFITRPIELREFYKFIYTKNISMAIELLAEVGDELGFSREQLAQLDYYSVVGCKDFCSKNEVKNTWKNLIAGRTEEKRINNQVSLPPILFSEKDFVTVPSYITKPNFITDEIIEGEVIFLENTGKDIVIENKIVVVEKADPGYDWIFTKNIKALITKYGGAASHMAIRCAEFRIPAAIGCGDLIFSKVCKASHVILDCNNKVIKTI
ncbi:MAG: adenylyltransferase/cytidyltransferase family protein [Bacteroidetes bacterium]|nr:adenylyltransferase/cytidyltransferase family protein [Bacteroidota bacterium]